MATAPDFDNLRPQDISLRVVTDYQSDPEPDYPDGYAVWEDKLLTLIFKALGTTDAEVLDIRDASEYISAWQTDRPRVLLIRNVWPSPEIIPCITAFQKAADEQNILISPPPALPGRKYGEDKTALAELSRNTTLPVPLTYLSGPHLRGTLNERSDGYIVKPLNGFSSHGFYRVGPDDEKCFLTTESADQDAPGKTRTVPVNIVQPWMPIENEASFYFVDNRFVYATESEGAGPDFAARWTVREFKPDRAELKLAEQFEELAGQDYGLVRVDIARLKGKGPVVSRSQLMELETFSPILSFDCVTDKKRQRDIASALLSSVCNAATRHYA